MTDVYALFNSNSENLQHDCIKREGEGVVVKGLIIAFFIIAFQLEFLGLAISLCVLVLGLAILPATLARAATDPPAAASPPASLQRESEGWSFEGKTRRVRGEGKGRGGKGGHCVQKRALG